jgi:hypothetical protein
MTDRSLCPCDPVKDLATAKAVKVRSEVHRVGTIHGLAIYDVFYYFEHDYYPVGAVMPPDWKSILVQMAPNSYREIYHCEKTEAFARPLPSVIKIADKEALLKSTYVDGGNKGGYFDDPLRCAPRWMGMCSYFPR